MQALTFSKLILSTVFLVAFSTSLTTAEASAVGNDLAQIEALIDGLDAKKYFDRESATEQLIGFGRESLKPVAFEYFDANPEMAWRIKRVLKRIATEAREELTSLQAIGVLIVMDQSQDQTLDSELTGLLSRWRENRSLRAIEYLVERGALTSPSGVHRQFFFGNLNLQQLSFDPAAQGDKNPLRDQPGNRSNSVKKIRAEIEELVEGDFESVQEFVFSRLQAPIPVEEQLAQPQIIVNGRQIGIGGNATRQNGTFLEIGKDWTGEAKDLKRLKEIHSLRALRFHSRELSKNEWQLIEELETLQHLGIVNSELAGSKSIASLDLPSGLNSLELGDIKIDSNVADWLASLPLNNLTLEKCTIDRAAATDFKELERLVTLDLKRIKIDRQLFRSLAEVTSLKRLNLSVCKFMGDDFRSFSRVRPRIAVFNPVSFLGVQARPTIGGAENWSCEIEMVVPESAADVAGVRAGDIIEAVNGDDVVSFQDLRMYISQYEIGEEMKLTVERSGQQIELTAKLGNIEDR